MTEDINFLYIDVAGLKSSGDSWVFNSILRPFEAFGIDCSWKQDIVLDEPLLQTLCSQFFIF